MLCRDRSMARGKENPLTCGKDGALGLVEVLVGTLTLQICSMGRSVPSSSLPLWQSALLSLTLTFLSFNQRDFNSSVVPPVKREVCFTLLGSSFTALQVFDRNGADCTLHTCERQGPRPPAMASSLTWDLCVERAKKTASPNDGFQASGFIILSEPNCKGMAPWERTDSSPTGNFPLPAPVCTELGVSPSTCDGKDACSHNSNFIFKMSEHRCFLSFLEHGFNAHSF